ncbi:cytochrome p450 [Stygiomarasmius scandens]|uniref:Cytochrome p450 n=1 Tax=Marasmiellus scandens TaxID=2682957 RepID=A0ABR1IPC6_9AGAR
MLSSSTIVVFLTCAICTCLIDAYTRLGSGKPPYPPGPRGYPYVGSINIPFKKPWFTYIEWGKKYGGMHPFNIIFSRTLKFGRHYLIINSYEIAKDLLEKDAQFTSDRSLSPLDVKIGWSRLFALAPYSLKWRSGRKLFNQNFRSDATPQFHPAEIQCIREFVSELATSKLPLLDQVATSVQVEARFPNTEFKLLSVSQKIMFKALYGVNISTNKDPAAETAREAIHGLETIMMPGLDALKFSPLHHLFPSLKSGSSNAMIQREVAKDTFEGPWAMMMTALKGSDPNHDPQSSLIPDLISKAAPDDSEALEAIKTMGGTAIAAAADTTMSAIATFFLAMSLYPNVQAKAQRELDTVIGPGKLPTFYDRKSLPYIEAVYREVMRWHPAIPMGLPHATTADIIYKGYYIPKGTIIFANIWAMTHNPTAFDNPDVFIPERHLPQGNGNFESINSILAYGFGRRVCVGRWMADDTIWLTIATVLATTKISELPNENVEDYFTDISFW